MHFLKRPRAELLLRAAIALTFLYPPIAAVFDPYSWISYFPGFLTDAFSSHTELLLHGFGLLEATLAFWILFGKDIRLPCYGAATVLLAIVAFNPGQFPILFRDLSLALAALALAGMGPRSGRMI